MVHLKMVKRVNFVLYVVYYNEKQKKLLSEWLLELTGHPLKTQSSKERMNESNSQHSGESDKKTAICNRTERSLA